MLLTRAVYETVTAAMTGIVIAIGSPVAETNIATIAKMTKDKKVLKSILQK